MKTKASLALFAVALASALSTGCQTQPILVTDAPIVRAGNGTDAFGHTLSSPERPAYTVSEKTEMMKVSVNVRPENEDAALFATGVKETVFTALRDRKFQVVDASAADLELAVSVGQKVFNSAAGEYFTLDGTVKLQLNDLATKNVLAAKILRDRNKPSLGRDKAALDLSETMKPAISDWIAEKVTPEQVPLEARTLRVAQIDRYPDGESAFIDEFVKAMSAMKGVLRCETADRDAAAKTASFRVLYRRADYPQGFLHAVINQNPKFFLVLQ